MDNLSTGYSALNLPFSPEAEQSVLGAILLDSSCLDRVAEILPRPDYFYQTNNGLIYGAMLDMFTLGKPVDFVTVLEKLKESREFDEASGKTYLLQLAQIVPSISNVESYARIVRDKYDIRTLITTAREIMEEAADGTADAATLLDSAEQRIFDIRRGKNMQGLQRIDEIIIQTLDRLDLLNSPDSDQYKGVPTGIKELDDTITGLNRSDLILLAARPGMGKTSFALNIARHAAVKADKRVAFFSLEMTKEQLVSRLLSTEALVGGTKLRTGKLTEEEWVRLIEGGDILSKTQMYFDDSSGITVPEMKAKLRRLKDVDLVVIDYLQLMSGSTKRGRKPCAGDFRDHAKFEDHGKGTQRPGADAVPALPCERTAHHAPPHALGPARFRFYRTGCGHRPVFVPRRLLCLCGCAGRIGGPQQRRVYCCKEPPWRDKDGPAALAG